MRFYTLPVIAFILSAVSGCGANPVAIGVRQLAESDPLAAPIVPAPSDLDDAEPEAPVAQIPPLQRHHRRDEQRAPAPVPQSESQSPTPETPSSETESAPAPVENISQEERRPANTVPSKINGDAKVKITLFTGPGCSGGVLSDVSITYDKQILDRNFTWNSYRLDRSLRADEQLDFSRFQNDDPCGQFILLRRGAAGNPPPPVDCFEDVPNFNCFRLWTL